MNKYIRTLSVAVSALFISQVNAGVTVLDFDAPSISNGTIVDNEYSALGVSITSLNYDNPTSGGGARDTGGSNVENVQVAFDTSINSSADPDLEYNDDNNSYNGVKGDGFQYTALEIDGVTYANTPGNVLIMQNAQNIGSCNDTECTNPNDENGTNAAGYFEFTFDTLVDIISLDTFDIEDNGEFVIQFFANDVLVETRVETGKSVGDTVRLANPIPDYTVQAGDSTLQTMGNGQFVRQLLNIVGIDMMRIQLPGSGAIDNLAFRTAEVSAPASLGILSLALLLMIRRARK